MERNFAGSWRALLARCGDGRKVDLGAWGRHHGAHWRNGWAAAASLVSAFDHRAGTVIATRAHPKDLNMPDKNRSGRMADAVASDVEQAVRNFPAETMLVDYFEPAFGFPASEHSLDPSQSFSARAGRALRRIEAANTESSTGDR